MADANTVIGEPIITVSGSQVIPLSSVTVVNLNGGGEYQYDTTQYIVEIEVTEVQSGILEAEQTIYKTGDKNQLNDETKTTEILFQNTTGQPGYVLPETGGAGITLFTAGGAALLALAGLMYPVLRGKGGEAP